MASKIKVNTVSDVGDNTIISSDGAGTVNITATSFIGDGSSLTGVSSVGGATGVDFNDNVKARFGTGNDLEIYHESSSNKSYIKESGSADLVIAGNDILFRNTDDTETMAYFQNNGAVTLKYNHSTKFATTSTGVTVTGTIVGDGAIANRFHAYGKNATGSNSGWRTIDFQTETVDDDNAFTHTSGYYNVPVSGTYAFFGGHNQTNGDHSDYEIQVNSNSQGTLAKTASPNTNQITISCIASVSQNEIITIQVYHSNANHADAGSPSQFFGGYRIA